MKRALLSAALALGIGWSGAAKATVFEEHVFGTWDLTSMVVSFSSNLHLSLGDVGVLDIDLVPPIEVGSFDPSHGWITPVYGAAIEGAQGRYGFFITIVSPTFIKEFSSIPAIQATETYVGLVGSPENLLGVQSVNFVSGAFGAAPEPSTWILMLLGFFGLAAFQRLVLMSRARASRRKYLMRA